MRPAGRARPAECAAPERTVGWADRLLHGARGWKGGWGIVLDDLVAAFCTLLVIALWRAW